MSGDLPLIEALVQRRIRFHVYNVTEHTPIELAMHWCRLPIVRFLVGCYQLGQRGHDALRDMMSTASEDEDGDPYPMIFLPIRQTLYPARLREAPILNFTPSGEERKEMVAYFVREGGADIWAQAYTHYHSLRTIYGSGHHDDQARRRSTVCRPAVLPLHMAACEGTKPLLIFFLTECKMPVNTRTPDLQLTALHCLAASQLKEPDLLPIVIWLVKEKGADVMCRDTKGYTAARVAAITK